MANWIYFEDYIQAVSKKSSHFRFANFSASWWIRIKSKDIFMMPCPRWIKKCPYFCKSIKNWVIGRPKCFGLSYYFVQYFLHSIFFHKLAFSCTQLSKNENDWNVLLHKRSMKQILYITILHKVLQQ